MRNVPQRMTDIWKSGQFTGSRRPIARATIQRTQLITRPYGNHRYASYIFGNPNNVYELPNVKSVDWQRSVDMDVATATITLYNTRELPLGTKPPADEPYNQPGYFTFNRGDELNRWNHVNNQWVHRLYPDQLIRTYEGYGFDPTIGPEFDPNMVPSGVWLIDDVELSHDGMITLKCRDAGRLLLDQIAFPPVVPSAIYPLHYEKYHEVANPKVPKTVAGGGDTWINPTYYDDSGEPYYGRNGSVGGHRPSDAFDGSNDTYWLSVGNGSPTGPYAYEWIEGTIPKSKVAAVRVFTKGGPYRMYVSLYDAVQAKWLGGSVVPYDPNHPASAPNGSNIPYVKSVSIARDSDVTVDVSDVENITRVRVCFHDLWDSNYGTYQYRAAVRDFDVMVTTRTTSTVWVTPNPPTHTEGNYDDYTDIVKHLLGYGGFLWPADTTIAYQMRSDRNFELPWVHLPSQRINMPCGTQDPIIKIGAIWGDLEQSGTYGPAPLNADIFDKKPLMDGIAYIRDMLGFIFYVDEGGGAQFRSPNVWSLGNWKVELNHREATLLESEDAVLTRLANEVVSGGRTFNSIRQMVDLMVPRPAGNYGTTYFAQDQPYYATVALAKERIRAIYANRAVVIARYSSIKATRTNQMVTIDEKQTLMSLRAVLTSRNVRERVVVANLSGNVGAVTKGFLPYRLPETGLRRVSIWSDQHFANAKECQIMADLIAVRQLFTYRTDRITIPGYPAIQIDDQVKIIEEVTEENNDAHYVKGINSKLDMASGEWTYELDTHWLGDQPYSRWAFDPGNLDPATQEYLADLGKVIS